MGSSYGSLTKRFKLQLQSNGLDLLRTAFKGLRRV